MFIPLRDDNPRQSFPLITLGLIVANVLVQVYQLGMSAEERVLFLRAAGVIPLEIVTLTDLIRYPDHPQALVPIPLTILTAMFVHGGWLHLISNMWFLWLFGDNVEDTMGHFRFILFYLLVGILATAAQIVAVPYSPIPMVGASGAVAGALGAYLRRFPHARVHTLVVLIFLVYTIEVPALIVLGSWFLLQLVNTLAVGSDMGGVAWFAHVAGFVAGFLLVGWFARRRRPPRSFH